ncbi:TolC family protein [Desulfocurvus sp. DL9XJH121]
MRKSNTTALAMRPPAPGLALACLGLLMGVLIWSTAARGQETARQDPALRSLVEEALANNQDLLALEDQVRALREEAPFAGSLPDPGFSLGLSNVPVDSFELDQEAMTQKQIGVSQQMPWFGTLGLAEKAAVLKADVQDRLVRAKRLELARQVAEAWYDLGFTARSLKVNAQLQAMVGQMLRVAETRYATGKGLQQDILSGQVRLSELLDEQADLERKRRVLADRINALLNREDLVDVEPPVLPEDEEGEPLAAATLATGALRLNPVVLSRRTAVDKAALDVDLARKDYYPDMNFRLGYGQRDEDPSTGRDRSDFVSASVTFSIPLWQATRQDSKLAAAQSRLSSARRSLAALERELPHRIDALVAEIATARENRRLFDTALTKQAEQAADSSLAAYSVGRVGFDSMVEARLRLVRFELRSEQYGFEARKMMARLEETLGGPVAAALAVARASAPRPPDTDSFPEK